MDEYTARKQADADFAREQEIRDTAYADGVAKERARWVAICEDRASDTNPPHKPHEDNYGDGWLDACNEIKWAGEKSLASEKIPQPS